MVLVIIAGFFNNYKLKQKHTKIIIVTPHRQTAQRSSTWIVAVVLMLDIVPLHPEAREEQHASVNCSARQQEPSTWIVTDCSADVGYSTVSP